MTTRRTVRRVFLMALTAALWTWSGGVASAQAFPPGCDDEESEVACVCGGVEQDECPPGPLVTCPAPEACEGDHDCEEAVPPVTCVGLYTPDQEANVFTFGDNNSIQVKFADVTCPFLLNVTLIPTEQNEFHERVKSTICTPPAPLSDDGVPPPEITCNETVVVDVGGVPTSFCAVYDVSQPVPPGCYTGPNFDTRVEYLIGWNFPKLSNKHYYYMLRDPDALSPDDDATACFIQNITSAGVNKKYVVGALVDPGLTGKACCTSEYVVVRNKIPPGQAKKP